MKKIAILIMSVIILITNTSCNKNKDNEEKEMIYCSISEPITIDPQALTDSSGKTIVLNMFEGLVKKDINNNIKPACAEKYYISNDKKTYIFTLRKNIKWSNGEEIKAEDFIYGIKRAIKYCKKLSDIESLSDIINADTYKSTGNSYGLGVREYNNTIIIQLKNPNENLLNDLTNYYSMPCNKEFFDLTMGQYGKESEHLITNGAFHISKYDWQHNNYIKITTNPYYYDNDNIKIAGVYFDLSNEKSTTEMLLNNQVDCGIVGIENYDTFNNSNYKINRYTDKIWCLSFNLSNKLLNNKNIRKGLCLSFDRLEILDSVPNYYPRAKTLFTKAFYYDDKIYTNSYEFEPNNRKTAKKLVAKGLKEEKTENLNSLSVLSDNSAFSPEITTELITSWNNISSSYINKNNVDSSELLNKLQNKDYMIAIAPIKIKSSNPLDVLKNFYYNDINNIIGLNSKEYKSFIDSEDFDSIINAENYLYDNYYLYPLYYEDILFVTSSSFKNIIFDHYNSIINFTYAGL